MAVIRQVVVRKVDWFRVLTDLRYCGLTLRVITACTGISRATLLDLRNQDADPKMLQGELLLELWCQTTGRSTDEVPRHGDPRPTTKPRRASTFEGVRICCPLCGKEHLARAAPP